MPAISQEDLRQLLHEACNVGLIDTFTTADAKVTLRRGHWECTMGPRQASWFLHGMLRAYVFNQRLEKRSIT